MNNLDCEHLVLTLFGELQTPNDPNAFVQKLLGSKHCDLRMPFLAMARQVVQKELESGRSAKDTVDDNAGQIQTFLRKQIKENYNIPSHFLFAALASNM